MIRYRKTTLHTAMKSSGLITMALLVAACEPGTDDATQTPVTSTVTPPLPELVVEKYAFEVVPADETAQIADIATKTMQLQDKRALALPAQNGEKLRGVHPKSHGCVVGELVVNQDIAPDLQVGLFSKPGQSYKTLIRYSNASVQLSDDLEGGKNGSRGMAIKVFDVDGDTLVSDKGKNNQDFLMINTPGFAFVNVRSYQRLTNALLASPSGADPRAAFAPADDWTDEDRSNLQKTLQTIGLIQTKTVRNPLQVQYFAAAPSSFGDDRVMKFSALPCGGEKAQAPFEDPSAVSADYLHEALVETMNADESVCLDLNIQVLTAEQAKADRAKSDTTGDLIEDATRVWSEQEYPFVNVAKITLSSPQVLDPSDPTQQECKAHAFNPWHALTAHKPLGGINRLRQPVYINSADNRTAKQ